MLLSDQRLFNTFLSLANRYSPLLVSLVQLKYVFGQRVNNSGFVCFYIQTPPRLKVQFFFILCRSVACCESSRRYTKDGERIITSTKIFIDIARATGVAKLKQNNHFWLKDFLVCYHVVFVFHEIRVLGDIWELENYAWTMLNISFCFFQFVLFPSGQSFAYIYHVTRNEMVSKLEFFFGSFSKHNCGMKSGVSERNYIAAIVLNYILWLCGEISLRNHVAAVEIGSKENKQKWNK